MVTSFEPPKTVTENNVYYHYHSLKQDCPSIEDRPPADRHRNRSFAPMICTAQIVRGACACGWQSKKPSNALCRWLVMTSCDTARNRCYDVTPMDGHMTSTQTWLRYSEDVRAYQSKLSTSRHCKVRALTDRQTHHTVPTEDIATPH